MAIPRQPFFTIVIPARNEEKYLHRTIKALLQLQYPRYEVIVVENGSTDRTVEIGQSFRSSKFRFFSADVKGVSGARNLGARHINPKTEWIIFLDADTILDPPFLNELRTFLKKPRHLKLFQKQRVIGTTQCLPYPSTVYARVWFAFYNLAHRVTKTSFAIQIVHAGTFKHYGHTYDENLRLSEDLKLIKDMRQNGAFFYMPTISVHTSTRRFLAVGWWRLAFHWCYQALLPHTTKIKLDYKVIR